MTRLCRPLWPRILLAVLALLTFDANAQELPRVSPEAAGMNRTRLAGIEKLALDGIREQKMPGCTICVGRQGKIVYLESFGLRKTAPDPEPMTTDTLFDLASLTKPVATATSIMKLVEDGQLRLGDRVVKFFPEFGANGKDKITIKDLLIHQSGLIPDNSLQDYQDGPAVAWQKICELGLYAPTGERFVYSDVNFIVLAKIVEQRSGQDVHQFSQATLFQPLQMHATGFVPAKALRVRAAPTEKRNGQWMRGEVHDPRAYRLNGIAGHAGLFSTASDLAIYANMMLGNGTHKLGDQQTRILSPATVAVMTDAYPVSSGRRGLGWDKRTGYSSNRGDLLSPSAFGHGGFTGTVLWIDPELDLFFIFLSNRVHPNGKGSVNHLAGRILNRIVSSIETPQRESQSQPLHVATGIDVLVQEDFRRLAGQRIGLITNHTGRAADGQTTRELMHQHSEIDLVALFSPEHGIGGKLDTGTITDGKDPQTGLTIFSLYGENRRPTAPMLAQVDTLVFDIQDIGTRFYTYISTMGEAMLAASEHDKKFVVLDRPNPIGGIQVAGPMLDDDKRSFVGFHSLPVRHGMTTGELARMIKAELKMDLDLEIVPCQRWQRGAYWDRTGLTWINPSPNMRSLTQAILYPGLGLLETTNVSVGRGTDTPFEILGAPWMDGRQLADRLNRQSTPGVSFVPIEFTPRASKFANQQCHGINMVITNRANVRPVQVGLTIAHTLRNLHPERWETRNFNRLLGNDQVYQALVQGETLQEILAMAQSGIHEFLARRENFLLYR